MMLSQRPVKTTEALRPLSFANSLHPYSSTSRNTWRQDKTGLLNIFNARLQPSASASPANCSPWCFLSSF